MKRPHIQILEAAIEEQMQSEKQDAAMSYLNEQSKSLNHLHVGTHVVVYGGRHWAVSIGDDLRIKSCEKCTVDDV